MPARNPGKSAFVIIIGLAALTGILFYVFSGIAMPQPGGETAAYDQGLPQPTIPNDQDGNATTDTASEQEATSNMSGQ